MYEMDVPREAGGRPRATLHRPLIREGFGPSGEKLLGTGWPLQSPYLGPGPAWSSPAQMTGLQCPVALQRSSKPICPLAVQPPTPTGEGPGSFFPALPGIRERWGRCQREGLLSDSSNQVWSGKAKEGDDDTGRAGL